MRLNCICVFEFNQQAHYSFSSLVFFANLKFYKKTGFFRVAVTRMARRKRRLQLQRWRRGTNLTPVTVSRSFLCNACVCHACQQERLLLFALKDKNKPSAMHGVIWKTPSGTKVWQHRNWKSCPTGYVFLFFLFFFSWDAAPCVLCNFLLAVARCANAHLRCMSLTTSVKICESKIWKMIKKPVSGWWTAQFCGSTLGLFGR